MDCSDPVLFLIPVLSYVECDDMLIKYVVMVSCFVCVGMGAAVSYGTTTQIVSLCQALRFTVRTGVRVEVGVG